MSEPRDGVRKRFLVNGETSAGLDLHGRYLNQAYNLLAQVKAGQLVQHQAEVDHAPQLVGTSQHGDITRRHYVDGATLRATYKGGQGEVSIDVHRHHVDSQPTGGDEAKPLPYLWVGARIKADSFGEPVWAWDSYLILGVWEPDGPDGQPRGIVCSHPPVRVRDHVTPVLWEGLQGTDTNQSDRLATAAVTIGENGLYMASAWWVSGSGMNVSTGWGDWCLEAPFDPMRPDTPDQQTRTVPQWDDTTFPLWAHVVVLDAHPEATPTDSRELLQIPQGLAALGITPTVLAGQYVVKVGLNEPLCEPMTVEIEVHLNKQPHTLVKRYEVQVEGGGTSYYRLMHPYGLPTELIHGCDYEVGDNPHWRNWWPGALLIDVLAGTIEPAPYHVPSHGFTPGPWDRGLDCDWGAPAKRVLFFGTSSPFSNAYMGAYVAQVLAVVDSSFEINPTTSASGLEAIWGLGNQYPVSATNPYWRTEGGQIPAPLAQRITIAEAHGVDPGVVYRVVYDPSLVWPARFSLSAEPTMNAQTLAGNPFAYQPEMVAIALALGADTLYVTVPGAHFNPIALASEGGCMTVTDIQTEGSPAVEVEPT